MDGHAHAPATHDTSGAHDHAHMVHGSSGSMGDGLWWSLSQWDVLALAVLAAILAAYLFLVWWSRQRTGGSEGRAALAFALGLAVIFVAITSPLVSLVRQESGSHLMFMVQLELLISVSPPLLLLGLRPTLNFFSERNGFMHRFSRLISSVPGLTLGIWLLPVYAWHSPALHMWGMMGSPTSYTLMLSSFMVTGLLFWWPLIEPARDGGAAGMRPLGKLGYLVMAQVGAGLLAAALIWYPGLVYNHGSPTQPFGLSGLADQKVSGVVMMVMDMTVASIVAGWIFFQALASADWQERLALRADSNVPWGRRIGAPLGVIVVGCALILGTAPALQSSGETFTRISLAPINNSGVSGTATFIDAAGGVEVGIDVRGLPEPGAMYLAHLHRGSCADDPAGSTKDHAHDHHGNVDAQAGEIEHPLTPIVSNSESSGSSTTVIKSATVVDLFSGEEFYINVHEESPGSKGLPDSIACGDHRPKQESNQRQEKKMR